jgi:hypothetical protein
LADVTDSSLCPWSWYLASIVFFLLVTLIHKLQHYGIIGKSIRWIEKWLANKKQSVIIDGSTSDAVSVDSGVPQGSVLGPIIYQS